MDAQSFTVEPYFIKFFRHISDKSFTMKEKNYPQVLYNDNFGIIHGEENTKTHDILLKFTTKQGQYIQTRPLHHTQEVISHDENFIIFKMHMKITFDLVQELLSYGSSLQVLSLLDDQPFIRAFHEFCPETAGAASVRCDQIDVVHTAFQYSSDSFHNHIYRKAAANG